MTAQLAPASLSALQNFVPNLRIPLRQAGANLLTDLGKHGEVDALRATAGHRFW